ncbi:MAG: Flp pilus assembly complex ATPase component [FCB group bacterium]|nr:Flp pilus assembly complex ATPase component [FCB group bacterium]
MAQEKKLLGQIMLDEGKIDMQQLEEALQYKQTHDIYLGLALIELGFVTEDDIIEAVSDQLKLPTLDPLTYEIENDVIDIVKEDVAKRLNIIPLFHIGNKLTVACSDPINVEIIDELNVETVMEINLVLAPEMSIKKVIDLYYGVEQYVDEGTDQEDSRSRVRVVSKEIAEDTEIIESANMLILEAVKIGASDIHIDPREKDVRIRYRVDGVLQQYYTFPRSALAPLISRIKILSNMDIAESRKPQDGRFHFQEQRSDVDIRSSTFPTPLGEKVVMRILDQKKSRISLEKMGFSKATFHTWNKSIHSPNGLIIVSGPTGSGKTTTLYATLAVVNTVEVNIMTVEDPIEYRLDNITQAQVNTKAGMTFSAALRSMLRQDPDIIMVGEIRDLETAELAVRAALTGHLVFSTIHTNDAASCFTRLSNMGMDAYLASSTVRAILAQRLIRLLCPSCKERITASSELLESLGITPDQAGSIYEARGCMHCKNSGYAGRTGVYELLVPDEEIAGMVTKNATARTIHHAAVEKGMRTLRESSIDLVITGKTSVEEMLRVTLE